MRHISRRAKGLGAGGLGLSLVSTALAELHIELPRWVLLLMLGVGVAMLVLAAAQAYFDVAEPEGVDRRAYVAGLQGWLVKHVYHEREMRTAYTDAAFAEAEKQYLEMVGEAANWIALNMGLGAGAHYAHGTFDPLDYPWPGEHSQELRLKRAGSLGHASMRMQINELLTSPNWDDPVPLDKRKRTAEWKMQQAYIEGRLAK